MVIEEFVGTLGLSGFGFELFERFKKGFDEIGSTASKASTSILGFGLAVAGITVHVAEGIDQLSDFGETIGLSVQELQALGGAALEVGVRQEKLNAALQRLAVSADDARTAGSSAAKAFHTLGVRATDATGHVRGLSELLPELADGFAKQHDVSKRAGLAMDLFGRQGVKLVGLLSRGSAGLAEFRENAERLGIVVDQETVKKLSHLSDSLDGLRLFFGSFATSIARGALLPLQRIIDKLQEFLVRYGPAIRNFLEGIASVAENSLELIVTGLLKFTGAVGDLGKALYEVNPALAMLVALGVAIAAAFFSPVIAFLLISAGLALLLDDINHFVNGTDSLIGRLVASWDEWINKLTADVPEDSGIFRFMKRLLAISMQLGKVIADMLTLNLDNVGRDFAKLIALGQGKNGVQADAEAARAATVGPEIVENAHVNEMLAAQGIGLSYGDAARMNSIPGYGQAGRQVTVPGIEITLHVAKATASAEEIGAEAKRAVKEGLDEHYERATSALGPGR